MPTPMNYRSTNVDNHFVHFGGAIVNGVQEGRGIELNPASTGASPNIQPVGDDANIGLTVAAKGTGQLTLGNSSNTVAILGTAQIGSTASGSLGFKGAFAATSTFSNAAIGASRSVEFTLSTAVGQMQVGDVISVGVVIDTANVSSAISHVWRASTAVASRVTIQLVNNQSTATSTLSGTFQLAWIDLT